MSVKTTPPIKQRMLTAYLITPRVEVGELEMDAGIIILISDSVNKLRIPVFLVTIGGGVITLGARFAIVERKRPKSEKNFPARKPNSPINVYMNAESANLGST